MTPMNTRKRKSDEASSFPDPNPMMKKRRMALTVAQKQALIDNLQLEITERARRLRAQYNVQAQQLRSRVEMRVNRIPTALRKMRMGELMAKHSETQKPRPQSSYAAKPPPVPVKDGMSPKPIPRQPLSASTRGKTRLSNAAEIDDKENSVEPLGNPTKKLRGAPAVVEASLIRPGQILSPTSTNARIGPRGNERPPSRVKNLLDRPASPAKSMIARPASPIKGLSTKSSSNLLSNMVREAKGKRGATAGSRTATTSTTTSSTAGTVPRTRKPAVPSAPPTASTRGRRKVSQASESSEASTGTVIKKSTAVSRTTASKSAPATKRTVMGTIKSATTKKAPATKAAAPATTGRTLRKRQA